MRLPAVSVKLVALVALASAPLACGGLEDGPRDDLERIADESAEPVYWLGPSFEGLPLTDVEDVAQTLREAPRSLQTVPTPNRPLPPPTPAPGPMLIYGECNGEGSGDSFHCTGPRIQLQHYAAGGPAYPQYFSCTRTTIRGAPAAQWDGFEVYTGATVVRIYATSQAQARRAARALRSVDDATSPTDPLPQPAAGMEPALRQCATDSVDGKLDELRRGGLPLLWLGREFEGRRLFRTEGDGSSFARLMYGGCATPEIAGSCYPDLTLELVRAAERWEAIRDGRSRRSCSRIEIRGTEALPFPAGQELAVFTGPVAVIVRGPDGPLRRRAAAALRGIDQPDAAGTLAPPVATIRDELIAVCPRRDS